MAISRDYLSSEDAWYLHAGIDMTGVADDYVVTWSESLHKFIVKPMAVSDDGGGAPAEHDHNEYLLKTGGAITGTVTVPSPVGASDVANRSYVDTAVNTIQHGSLPDLNEDHHTHYILVDGSRPFTTTPTVNGSTIWHAGNDGAGSGLDADRVDGQHASAFAAAAHTHSGLSTDDHDHDAAYVNESDHNKALHDAMGINAATLAGVNAGQFLRSDASDSATGILTFSNSVIFNYQNEGLEITGNSNYFGSNLDARVIRLVDQNGASGVVDGGLVFEAYTIPDSIAVELLVMRNNTFTWKGNDILHTGNHGSSGDPHTQYVQQTVGDSRYLRADTNTTYSAGTLNLASGTILDAGLGTLRVSTPTDDNHAANKSYVDSVVQGLDFKQSVRAVATSPLTLSGTQTVDGVSLGDGDRALVAGQASQPDNGIWIVRSGAWERPADFDGNDTVTEGAFVFVEDGGQFNNTGWVLGELTGSWGSYTEMTWSQFSGAGETVEAGDGLTKSGAVVNVGQGVGISVGIDTVSLDLTYTDGRYLQSDSSPEYIADIVGAMFSGNTETGIAATYQDADNTIDLALSYGTPVSITPDLSNSAGSGSLAARSNHIHNIPAGAAVTISNTSSNAEGTATNFARSDHTHAVVITEAGVTQHQAALAITESQITDLDHYTSTDFTTDFNLKSTTDLSEGSNLYYTTIRANSAIDDRVNKAFVDALNVDADTVDGLHSVDIELNVQEYVQSRGESLVTNGFGLLGDNTNFTGFTYEPVYRYAGGGSFTISSGSTTQFADEFIPVDPNKRYEMSYAINMLDDNGGQIFRHYGMVICYDADKLSIPVYSVAYIAGTETELAQPLNPGDTEIHLVDSSNWRDTDGAASHFHSIVWYPYTNTQGYTYPDYTYSRNYLPALWDNGAINDTTHVITLNQIWSGPALAAGTKVANSHSGGGYNYIAGANDITPTEWTIFSGIISGLATPGTFPPSSFRQGTAFVRVGWLLNRDGIAPGTTAIDGVSFGLDISATSHNHDYAYYTEAEVDSFLASKSNTGHIHAASDVTSGTFDDARISATSVQQHVTKTHVDSLNINANLLDGIDSTAFLRSNEADTWTQKLTWGGGASTALSFGSSTAQLIDLYGSTYGVGIQSSTVYVRTSSRFSIHSGGVHDNAQNNPGTGGSNIFTVTNTEIKHNTNTIWTAGNDGAGSGLDADTVDGLQASAFATSGHNHDSTYVNATGDNMTGELKFLTPSNFSAIIFGTVVQTFGASRLFQIDAAGAHGWNIGAPTGTWLQPTGGGSGGLTISPNLTVTGNLTVAGNSVLTTANEGAGNGIDADTVDGQHASAFAPTSHNHTTAQITSGTFANTRISATSVQQHVTKTYVDTLNVNADTVDGQHATAFAEAIHSHGNSVATATIGNGVDKNISVTHNLNTTDVVVQIQDLNGLPAGSALRTISASGHTTNGLTWDGTDFWMTAADTAYRIDPTDGTVLQSFVLPSTLSDITWDGTNLWVIGSNPGNPKPIYKVDPSNGTVLSTITGPDDLLKGLTWVNGYLRVSSENDILIHRLDPADGTVLDTIPHPAGQSTPRGLTYDGTNIYAIDSEIDMIYVLDPSTGSISNSFSYGDGVGRGLAWDGTGLWYTNFTYDMIAEVSFGNATGAYTTHIIEDEDTVMFRFSSPPDIGSIKVLFFAGQFTGTQGVVTSDDITRIVKLTQVEYDALNPPNGNTLYVVVN